MNTVNQQQKKTVKRNAPGLPLLANPTLSSLKTKRNCIQNIPGGNL